MDIVTLKLDEKGYAYSYCCTLESDELPERGGYFAIHDNRGHGTQPFSVSFFATDAPCDDTNSWTHEFRDFKEVVRYFQALGIRFAIKTDPVQAFLDRFK